MGVKNKVSLHKGAVPGRLPGSVWQDPRGVVVCRIAGPSDDVAEASSEPGIIRAMLSKDLEIQMIAQIEQSLEPNTAEALVAGAGT